MSEDELALLIFSVNSGLSKLRLVDKASEDEVDYSVTRAFVDAKGRTRQHFSPDDFLYWVRTNKTPLAALDSLSLLARLQRIIGNIQARAQHLQTLVKYGSASDKVICRLHNEQLRCSKIFATLRPVIGKVSSRSASVLIEVTETVTSMLVVQQSGLPQNKSTVYRKKCLLLANVPMLIKTPKVLQPCTLYKFTFTGFGEESSKDPSVLIKTTNSKSTRIADSQTVTIVCNSTSPHNNSRAVGSKNNMYKRMNGANLIIRLDKHVINEPEELTSILQQLENELLSENDDSDDDEEDFEEGLLPALDLKIGSQIRSLYRKTFNHSVNFESCRSAPTLHVGNPDIWMGLDENVVRKIYPNACAFIKGILEVTRREYVEVSERYDEDYPL